jgi:outer membrane protein assembly factor BamB
MGDEVFSVPASHFHVFRAEDGTLHWQGSYEGITVIAARPLDDNSGCVVLLDPGAMPRSTFENLFCVDANGKVMWKAQLPQSHDAFVDLQLTDALYANSWSGYRVKLDPATGKIVDQVFVK